MVEIQKKSTAGSALALVVIAAAIVAVCIGVVAYLYTHPDVLDGMIYIVAIASMVILAICVIAFVAYLILGVAYYATKGEITQTGISYDIDDVESVKESSSEEVKNR